MAPTPLDVLVAARKKLTDPTHWLKGKMATTRDGSLASLRSPAAECFCLAGALRSYATGKDFVGVGQFIEVVRLEGEAETKAEQFLTATSTFKTLWHFNDSAATTHQDVLAFLDDVIAHERAKS